MVLDVIFKHDMFSSQFRKQCLTGNFNIMIDSYVKCVESISRIGVAQIIVRLAYLSGSIKTVQGNSKVQT